ncbi:MAG: glycoside hydrolase family 105 protein [Bryobacteraceae bacterium]
MHKLYFLGSVACLFALAPAAGGAGSTPPSWAIAMADTLMKRNPGTPQDRLARWSYWKGYTLLGFEMLWRATGDRRYLGFITREIEPFVDKDGNLVNVRLNSLDNIMAGAVLVALYEHTHDARYRVAAGQVRRAFDTYPRNPDGGFWHSPGLPGEMWVDGVFMGQTFLVRYGQSIGDREYCFDEATRQIAIFATHARKGDGGLYYHAWAAKPELALVVPERKNAWADPKTGLSSEVWSEGLGWYALVVVETLAALPADHPRRAEVLDIYTRLAAALKRTQDGKTGGWFQVVDKGNRGGNWIDSSGSAMLTYALRRGIDLGLLSAKAYGGVVKRGYEAIAASAKIDDDGLVDVYGACDGLCVQASYADYIHCKKTVNAKEAVAGFLWATTIMERAALEKRRRR